MTLSEFVCLGGQGRMNVLHFRNLWFYCVYKCRTCWLFVENHQMPTEKGHFKQSQNGNKTLEKKELRLKNSFGFPVHFALIILIEKLANVPPQVCVTLKSPSGFQSVELYFQFWPEWSISNCSAAENLEENPLFWDFTIAFNAKIAFGGFILKPF